MYQYNGSVQTDAAFSSEIQEVDMEDVGQDYDGKSLRSLINRSKKDVVEVPLKKTDQVVEIDLSQVHNAGEIFDILNQENSEMLYYLLFAIEFTKRDQDEDAIAMAEQGLNAPGNDQSKVALLNLLASLYIRKGRTLPSTAKDERATCYAQATERYNQTSQIDSRNPITWVGKGLLYLARNDGDLAARAFDNALEFSPNNLMALFGRARILYLKKNYKEALRTYQHILKLAPKNTPDPRVGIGLCYNKLNMYGEAYYAFERAVKVNPDNVSALILLATMDFNGAKNTEISGEERFENFSDGLHRLKQAHKINPKQSMALNLLANYFFLKRDLETALDLARRAEVYHDSRPILAESHYQQARVFHILEDWEKAFYHYQQAVIAFDDHIPAQFGLGQCWLHRKEYNLAKEKFERVLQKDRNDIDARTVLCALKTINMDKDIIPEVRKDLEGISALKHEELTDPTIHIELGRLWEDQNLYKSRRSFMKAAEIYEQRGELVPPALLNELGYVQYRRSFTTSSSSVQKLLNDALDCFKKALETVQSLPDSEKNRLITGIMYNIGLTYEQLNRNEEAKEVHTEIVRMNPGYNRARLRLGVLEEKDRNYRKAEEIYKEIISDLETDTEARIRLATLATQQHHYRTARHGFEKLLSTCDKHNIYALTVLGCFWLNTARDKKDDYDERARAYQKACEFFRRILQLDGFNFYAANGVAVAMAETGRVHEAKDVFIKLREHVASYSPEININLAHACVETGEYERAAITYESVSKKRYKHKNPEILLWIARAHYLRSKETRDHLSVDLALRWTEKAHHLQPTNVLIIYNMAMLAQVYCATITERNVTERSLKQLNKAVGRANWAKTAFSTLMGMPETEAFNVTRYELTNRERYSVSLIHTCKAKLDEQREYERLKMEAALEGKRKYEELQKKRAQAMAEEEARRKAEQEAIEENRRLMEERVKIFRLEENSDEEKEEKRRKKGKRKADEADGSSRSRVRTE